MAKKQIKECTHCGSTIVYRYGQEHCKGDNLYSLKLHFDQILSLEKADPQLFAQYIAALQDQSETMDMFVKYWGDKVDKGEAVLECRFNELNSYTHTESIEKRLPLPSSSVPLPDLAEVYLAEHMLGRELNEDEKKGVISIPKISEEGIIFFAPLTWLQFPKHFSTDYKDMHVKTDYDEAPIEPILDFEALDGLYSRRRLHD